jgi:ribose transport system substrate-binding protein
MRSSFLMKNRPAFKLFICLAAAALVAAACATQQQGGGQQGAAGKRLRLAFVTNNASDYWTIARKGTDKAVRELGNVDLEFRMPGEGSAAEQKRIVDDLLAKGIDGMAISPVDPANQTQMINDAARQVLVITQDSDAPDSQRACYIGTNNREAGRQAGQLIRETLPQGGRIMVFVGKADAQNARERFEGMKEALAGSNIEVIDLRTDDADRVRAKSNAAVTLVRYPEVAAMVGLWAYNGPAILSAVRDAGKVGQVKIIAFDEEDDTLKGIQEGAIAGTVVQQPYEFGYQSIKTMAQIVSTGDRSMIPPSKQIFVPTKVIKRENVEEFTRQLNQLRGRS